MFATFKLPLKLRLCRYPKQVELSGRSLSGVVLQSDREGHPYTHPSDSVPRDHGPCPSQPQSVLLHPCVHIKTLPTITKN